MGLDEQRGTAGAARDHARMRAEARRRLAGMRPCYLGFGLFWIVSFSLSFTTGAPRERALAGAVTLAVVPVVCGLLAARAVLSPRVSSDARDVPQLHATPGTHVGPGPHVVLAALSGVAELAGLFLAYATETPLAGACLSLGSAGFILLQQRVLVAVGPRGAAIVGAGNALLAAPACVILVSMPDGPPRLAIEVALLLAAVVLQCRAMTEIRPPIVDPAPGAWGAALRMLWRPSLCTTIFALMWKLSQAIAPAASNALAPLTLGAFGLAALLLFAQSLLARRQASLVRTYRILFPLVTGAFLLLPILGDAYGPALSALLMFGFEIVNLLLIFFCAQVAHDLRLPSASVYAMGVGPTFVAMLAGQLAGLRLADAVNAASVVHLSGIALGAVYLLSLVLLLVTRRSGTPDGTSGGEGVSAGESASEGTGVSGTDGAPREAGDKAGATASPAADPRAAMAELAARNDLTAREAQVALLIAQGRSVPVISDTLGISQNTVRGHAKRVYAKLGIHSKQDLIDLTSMGPEAAATASLMPTEPEAPSDSKA